MIKLGEINFYNETEGNSTWRSRILRVGDEFICTGPQLSRLSLNTKFKWHPDKIISNLGIFGKFRKLGILGKIENFGYFSIH
jgi:hypothetical protein